jgi:preprotein translocase subunit SecA
MGIAASKLAEMETGEQDHRATLARARALAGYPVHVITVNDPRPQRDFP